MATRHFSVRLDSDTIDRLDYQSRTSGRTRSDIAKTLIEEGLRMEAHPGIVFRPGPTGRRPGLAGGPDVWEVAQVFRALDSRGEQAISETAELTGLVREQVHIAIRYYAQFQGEVDQWLQRLNDEADRLEAAWLLQQAMLAR
ncbi:MAG: ribbon-helix-helix protein, CopG family [Dehalococcoidia bacterium]|nr:ribbon-helix-helix protein, CopG family [Dehalococcoidia bacterium]